MVSRPLPHRPRLRALLALTWALACLSAAVMSPLPPEVEVVTDAVTAAGEADDDRVSALDLRPPPGAVLPPGPVLVAARVTGDHGPIRFTVDGEPATGRPSDPDGDLTALDGVEVSAVAPGPRRLAVLSGETVLREWTVVVAGVDVSTATEAAEALATRLAPAAGGPAVLFDPARSDLALAVPPLVAATGGTPVPAASTATDRDVEGVLAAVARTTGAPILVGDPDEGVAREVELRLRAAGHQPVRIAGADTTAVLAATAAARPAPTLVVAPAEPYDRALAAASAAARLRTGLVLVGPAGPDEATAAVIGTADALLVADDLGATPRRAVLDAMRDGAVASDDDLRPGPAQEAVVVPDATDRGRAVVAAALAAPGRPVLVGVAEAVSWVASGRPGRVTVLDARTDRPDPTGPAEDRVPADPVLPALATTPALDPAEPAVEPVAQPAGRVVRRTADVVAELRRAWVDGPDAPDVEALVDPGDALEITLTADIGVADADVHVAVLGYEWPGETTTDGRTVRWVGGQRPPLPLPLEPAGRRTPLPVVITTATTADGRTRHQTFTTLVGVDPADAISREGWVVAGGTDAPVGTGGRQLTYSVEVEPATGLDIGEVEAEVTAILTDPRSWVGDGQVTWQRVGSDRARIRVVVARPATVDAYCGAVGLQTGGRVSCWDGYRAMLNLDRWRSGVLPFHADLPVYRAYLVNHEVGHGLGHGHRFCGGPGQLAPIMQQQTGGLQGCRANGWPFPEASG